MKYDFLEVVNMAKDIFNGNIKKEYINYVKFSLILATVLFLSFFLFFLLFALFYEKIEYAARIFMFAFSGICLIASFLYPVISIYAIKNYSKHPKLAKAMIKPFVFQDFETDVIHYIIDKDTKRKHK